MLTISYSQFAVLQEQAQHQFRQRLFSFCDELEHTVSGQAPLPCTRERMDRYIDYARQARFMAERDIARFVVLCAFFEGKIPADKQARDAVRDITIDPSVRITRLYEAALASLAIPDPL